MLREVAVTETAIMTGVSPSCDCNAKFWSCM